MSDRQDDQENEQQGHSPASPEVQKTTRDVVVTYLDSPPPSGKKNIHPRPPAPIVPTREQRTDDLQGDGTDANSSRK